MWSCARRYAKDRKSTRLNSSHVSISYDLRSSLFPYTTLFRSGVRDVMADARASLGLPSEGQSSPSEPESLLGLGQLTCALCEDKPYIGIDSGVNVFQACGHAPEGMQKIGRAHV